MFKETATFTQNKPLIIDITPLPAATSFVNGVYILTEKKKNRKQIKLDGENTESREKVYKNIFHLNYISISILKLNRES